MGRDEQFAAPDEYNNQENQVLKLEYKGQITESNSKFDGYETDIKRKIASVDYELLNMRRLDY